MLQWGFGALLVHEGAAFCSAQPALAVSRCAEHRPPAPPLCTPIDPQGEGISVHVLPKLMPEKISAGDNEEQPSMKARAKSDSQRLFEMCYPVICYLAPRANTNIMHR